MKTVLTSGAAALFAFSAIANADSGAYIGLGYGEATYQGGVDIDGLVNQTYAEIPLRPIDEGQPIREGNRVSQSDDEDDAWKIYGGYRFNTYLALELAYADMGSVGGSVITDELEAISDAGEGGEGVFRGSQRTNFSYEAQVFALSARGTIPLGRWFNLFGKLGATYYDTELTRSWLTSGSKTIPGQESVDASFNSPASKKSESGYSWLYGVGAGVNIGEHWGINLEYESYQDIEFNSFVDKDNIDVWSASVEYRF
jgi:opacity protein-like surface antigen